jgi:hypothetical protein
MKVEAFGGTAADLSWTAEQGVNTESRYLEYCATYICYRHGGRLLSPLFLRSP